MSVDAAGHHVLIAVARRAGVGEPPGEVVGVELLETFHLLGRVAALDPDPPAQMAVVDLANARRGEMS